MFLGYAILVNDQVHNFMRKLEVAIQRDYGVNPGLKQPPHITFKQPFEAQQFEPFERYLDRLADEVDPFEIVMRGVGFFDEFGIIFLDVVQDPKLKALQRRVLHDLKGSGVTPASFEDERYHFHATVAWGLGTDNFLKARDALKVTRAGFRFVAEKLGLFYNVGPEEWIVYRQSSLRRGR